MYFRKIELKPKDGGASKTKKYVWECSDELPRDPVTGKRRRMSSRGKTKQEAKAKLEKKMREITEYGLTTEPSKSNITFEELAKQWLALRKGNIKNSSYITNVGSVNRLSKYLAKVSVRQLTKREYQQVLTKMEKDGFSNQTIMVAHSTAKMIFKQGCLWDVISRSPADGATLPKKKITIDDLENGGIEETFLEKEELMQFMEITKTHGLLNDYIVFLLLAFTGLRIGELLALKWTDVDMEQKELRISKTLFNVNSRKDGYELNIPKTATSFRIIALDNNIIAALKKHRSSQNELKIKNRKFWHDENFVITRHDGYPFSPRFVHHRLKRLECILREEKGINKKLHPHIFRHTHTSLLAEAGIDLRSIMQRLGHSDEKTTLAVYTHVTKKMQRETADKLGEVFSDMTGHLNSGGF